MEGLQEVWGDVPYTPLEPPPPPLQFPTPWGGMVTWPNKHRKYVAPKKNFYKAPKLIYTVILWYRFVVQCPPPFGGGPSLGDEVGGGGRVRRGYGAYGGAVMYLHRPSSTPAPCERCPRPPQCVPTSH